jgi:spore maturation protein CgeB
MQIAFFGSSLTSAYWNGAATYYRGIIRALYRLGYRITFYEPDVYGRQAHRDIPNPAWARVVVYAAQCEDNVTPFLEEAAKADVLIKASGVGVFDEMLEAAIPQVARPGTLKVFWDVDAPATLDRLAANPSDAFCPLIPRYDLILTYGGGKPVVDRYRQLGARQCVPIYNALDPETHFPAPAERRFACDLAFLGNRLPDRETRVHEFFFNTAAALPEKTFLIGGMGWQEGQLGANVRYAGHVYTADHNAFNSSPLALLNVSRASMARYGYSPATRVFEAAGAGACLITDHWEGIGLFLEPDREVLVVQNSHDIVELLQHLRPAHARRIGQAALARVRSEHTYSKRAEQFSAAIGEARSQAA